MPLFLVNVRGEMPIFFGCVMLEETLYLSFGQCRLLHLNCPMVEFVSFPLSRAKFCINWNIRFIHSLDEEYRLTVLLLIEKMLTNKKFKDFFQENVAMLWAKASVSRGLSCLSVN
ncbi:hypothetical protein DSECCO2_204140 [anaerobic digester metagenome]